MTERRRRTRFLPQALRTALVSQQSSGNRLQRDPAPESQVLGQVHDAHTTFAQQPENPVVADDRSDSGP
jgi:hypothetical protein